MSQEPVAALRFLIVDDEPLMINLSRRVLEDMGAINIESAPDGAAALAHVRDAANQTDIVLCDLNMPQMDGVELTRHLAEAGFAGGIIFLSGEEDGLLRAAKQVAEAHRLNVLGTLQKPDIVQPLKAAVSRYRAEMPRSWTPTGPQVSEQELADALARNEILLHYQPQLDVKTGVVHAVEALARWQHPVHGLLAPWKFIPLAERTGQIETLTDQVLIQAFRKLAEWRKRGFDLQMAVNVPMQCFEHLPFVEFLAKAAADEHINLENLTLEVTESQLMRDLARSLEVLARLRIKRVCLAIDDFGTGYSSMQQLKQLPIQELKIDRGFVSGATHDPRTRAILESTVSLAQRLGLRTVAEGVETDDEYELVRELGCTLVQGYYFTRPLAADEFEKWLMAREGPPSAAG
jgi:EAL domain-containing protein (putative c-di-GMP-specific phosphodiesterase class I)